MVFSPPVDFIPPLEERGLNYKVDLYIVKLVLDILKQRKVDGLPLLPISVNLSRTDFVKADMVVFATPPLRLQSAIVFMVSSLCVRI